MPQHESRKTTCFQNVDHTQKFYSFLHDELITSRLKKVLCWLYSGTVDYDLSHSHSLVVKIECILKKINNKLCVIFFSFFSRLDHPNIVKLLDVFEDKSHVYLVMEL